MKLPLKKTTALLAGILAGGTILAQTPDTGKTTSQYVQPFSPASAFNTWSIGIGAGVLTPFTILGSNRKQDFTQPNGELGYSAYIKKQITPAFGLQADYLGGKLSGTNGQPLADGTPYLSGFDTRLHYSVSLSANVTVGNISWNNNKSAIQPYLTFGGGEMNYTPVRHYADGTTADFKLDNSGTINEVFVPVGVGFKFDIARNVNIDLGYQVNFVYADNVDGYNRGSSNDKFSYAHLGLEFTLGSSSKHQLATHNPVSSMRTEYMMENQNTRNTLQAEINAERARNAKLRSDLDQTNANLAKFTVDTDGDGVPDFYDKCPNTPAGIKVDGSGCPLPVNKPDVKVYITQQDKEVVNEAVRNLEFDFGKATIRSHSDASLDKLAQLLIDKKFHLKLSGYTDNIGSYDANLKLSKDRAEAIKTYVTGKGADASLIQAEGYGKSNPIATNRTEAGRQKNRRVEFSIY